MHSWCTLGAHLVNSLPFYDPSTLLSYQSFNPYSISMSTSITLSILSLSPHLSLYLFYLYLLIYPSIHSISFSTSMRIDVHQNPYMSEVWSKNSNVDQVLKSVGFVAEIPCCWRSWFTSTPFDQTKEILVSRQAAIGHNKVPLYHRDASAILPSWALGARIT